MKLVNPLAILFTNTVIDRDISPTTHWIVSGDLDNDGFADIVAISFGHGGTTWYKNPGSSDLDWIKQETIHDLHGSIHADLFDMNNDGYLDLVMAYNFGGCFMHCVSTDGSIAWLENPGISDDRTWKHHHVIKQFGSGVHRVIATKFQGEAVIIGKGMVASGGPGTGIPFNDHPSKQVLYRRRNKSDPYSEWLEDSVLVDSLHLVHEMVRFPSNEDSHKYIMSSYDGIHEYDLDKKTLTTILSCEMRPYDNMCGWISTVAYEVVEPIVDLQSGNLIISKSPFYATIENLHGNKLFLYQKINEKWNRFLLDERDFVSNHGKHSTSDHGGHDVKIIDINCDGFLDIIVAWRGENSKGKAIALYIQEPNSTYDKNPEFPNFRKFDYMKQSVNGLILDDFDRDGIVDIGYVGWGELEIGVLYNTSPLCVSKLSYP